MKKRIFLRSVYNNYSKISISFKLFLVFFPIFIAYCFFRMDGYARSTKGLLLCIIISAGLSFGYLIDLCMQKLIKDAKLDYDKTVKADEEDDIDDKIFDLTDYLKKKNCK